MVLDDCSAIGTRVFCKKNGKIKIVPPDAAHNYKPSTGEEEVKGVISIDISFRTGEPIKAKIEMELEYDFIETKPTYFVIHPQTGKKVILDL